jgi:hypothetical protein
MSNKKFFGVNGKLMGNIFIVVFSDTYVSELIHPQQIAILL